MPECYTHARTALQALIRSGHTVGSHASFIAGASGPGPLYSFKQWNKKGHPNLPEIAERIRHERTGEFLLALARYAATSEQQSYAMGFFTHYTTDCTLQPYLAAMAGKGMPYHFSYGQYLLTASLDSELYYKDYKHRMVPLQAGTPMLIANELAQVSSLLHNALLDVYGEDVPLVALADAFHDNIKAHKKMQSRFGAKRFCLRHFGQGNYSKLNGPFWCRTQPAPPLKQLPTRWKDPFTKEEMNLSLYEVLTVAEQTGAVCVTAAMRYWLGTLEEEKLAEVLGSNDYMTGLSAQKQAEPEEPTQPEPQTAPV